MNPKNFHLDKRWLRLLVFFILGVAYYWVQPSLTSNPPSQVSPPPSQPLAQTPSSPSSLGQFQAFFPPDIKRGNNQSFTTQAGLIWTRGSEEKHRLFHVMRHLKDLPGRPGPHGVFLVKTPRQMVELIDTAYLLSQSTPRSLLRSKRQEDRDILDIRMNQLVGYIGGQQGQRLGHPKTHALRLVITHKRQLITAYPIQER